MSVTVRRNKYIVFCEIIPWLWRAVHSFWVLVADDRIPSSNNWSSICEHIEKKILGISSAQMCMVYFMTSNKANSDQTSFYKHFHTYENERAMKEWETLQKICKFNRPFCSTTFLTNEMWNHQTQVSNKASLTSTYRFFKWLSQLEDIEIQSPWDKLLETGNS